MRSNDLIEAENMLNEDHYGLEKIKERILEFLAVRQLVKNPKGTILCFVGAPGVGKTSLGKSIAKATGRKFVRLALGGVHDEAEIRGHRRTYIGALPGQIVQLMKRAGTVNPVILLDEVDKLGKDFRGDPSGGFIRSARSGTKQYFPRSLFGCRLRSFACILYRDGKCSAHDSAGASGQAGNSESFRLYRARKGRKLPNAI